MSTPGWNFGDDVLQVTDLDHDLFGGGGNDLLLGAESEDGLDGGTGDDWLYGADGADNLTGGKGNDLLIGGGGDDIFAFGAKSGRDVITDFDVGEDVLRIAKTKTIKYIVDVIQHAKQHGDDLVITLSKGQTITLKDVTKAEFKHHPSDHIEVI